MAFDGTQRKEDPHFGRTQEISERMVEHRRDSSHRSGR